MIGRILGCIVGFVYGESVLVLSSVTAFFFGTFGVLPFVVIPKGKREKYTIVTAGLWARLVTEGLLLARPRVTGEARVREGALFICNHRSWLDPLLMITHTRSQGLSKGLIYWIPFVGIFGSLTGAVFFNRKSFKARKKARNDVLFLIRSGFRIHVFPEGTRTRTGEILKKIYLTLPKDCFEANIPVVPCAVWGTERVLPATAIMAIPFQPCRLDIGEPMHPKDYPDAQTFADACWAEVLRRVELLKAEDAVPARTSTDPVPAR